MINEELWFPTAMMSPDEGSGGGGEFTGGSGGGGEPSGGGGTSGSEGAGADAAVASGENFDIPLGDDLDSVTMPEMPETAPQGAQGGAKATVTPPAAVGQQQAAPVAPQVAPTAPIQQAPAAPEDDTDGSFDNSPQNVINQLTESSEAYAEHFGNELFGLSPQEVEALQVNPEVVLPRLMGRVLVQAMRSIPHQIMQYVPGIINSQMQHVAESNRAENEFLAAWPGLGNHRDVAERAIRATVAAYGPGNLSRQNLIRYSGMLAFQMLGQQTPAYGGQSATAQGGGRAQGSRSGSLPFVPAGSAAGSNGGGPAGEVDPWAGFTLDD